MNNKQFTILFRGFSKLLPYLAILVLVANYGGAGFATYLFLQMELAPAIGLTTAAVLAAMVGAGVQGLRGVIVYFDLMTPNRLSFNRLPEVIALIFTLFTIFEIKLLTEAVNLSSAVFVSLTGLQAAGLVAEVFLLRQFRHHINYELSRNPAKVREIVKTNQNIANLEAWMDQVQEAMKQDAKYVEEPDFIKALDIGSPKDPYPSTPARRSFSKGDPSPELYRDGRDFPEYDNQAEKDAGEINERLERENYHKVVAVPRSQMEVLNGQPLPIDLGN